MRPQRNDEIARLVQEGRFAEALPLAEQRCASGGPAGADQAEGLTLLGLLRRELGHYSQAEPPLLQALSLLAAGPGKDHPAYAGTLHELARLYEETAQYPAA